MLSFDITDRRIKVVTGKPHGDSVRVSKACVIDLEPGIIFNGVVNDLPMAANQLSARLRRERMRQRKAIVSITSNLIVFKELQIPSAKSEEFSFMVYHQMQSTMGISDEYCISYTIIGETSENGKNKMYRVLATACPQRVVESYRQLFAQMGIKLKAVYVSSNSLAKVFLHSSDDHREMPLLLTQVDRDFITMSVFNQGQLQFSRFVRISQADYGADTNYLAAAAAENIFRMSQFYRNSIQSVVLCGQVEEFRPFQEAMEPFGINPSVFDLPAFVQWPQGISPLLYVNAVGALLGQEGKLSNTNMLETIDLKSRLKRKKEAFGGQLAAVFLALSLLVGSTYAGLSLFNTQLEFQVAEFDLKLNDPENVQKREELQTIQLRLEALRQYAAGVQKADTAFTSLPKLDQKVLVPLESLTGEEVTLLSYSLEQNILTVELTAQNVQAPSAYVQRLAESGAFDFVEYSGFQEGPSFTLRIALKGGETP